MEGEETRVRNEGRVIAVEEVIMLRYGKTGVGEEEV